MFHFGHDSQTIVAFQYGPHGAPLYITSAIADGDVAETIVQNLIKKGAQADRIKDGKYGSALHVAAYSGRCTTVRLLLKRGGASVNREGGMFGTALHAAAAKGHTNVVQELLIQGADPTMVSGFLATALQAALVVFQSGHGTLELLQEAIEAKLSVRRGVGLDLSIP